jgi:hypothetical protein
MSEPSKPWIEGGSDGSSDDDSDSYDEEADVDDDGNVIYVGESLLSPEEAARAGVEVVNMALLSSRGKRLIRRVSHLPSAKEANEMDAFRKAAMLQRMGSSSSSSSSSASTLLGRSSSSSSPLPLPKPFHISNSSSSSISASSSCSISTSAAPAVESVSSSSSSLVTNDNTPSVDPVPILEEELGKLKVDDLTELDRKQIMTELAPKKPPRLRSGTSAGSSTGSRSGSGTGSRRKTTSTSSKDKEGGSSRRSKSKESGSTLKKDKSKGEKKDGTIKRRRDGTMSKRRSTAVPKYSQEEAVRILQKQWRGYKGRKEFRRRQDLQKRRTRIAQEILQTEKSYIVILDCIVTVSNLPTYPFLNSLPKTDFSIFSSSQHFIRPLKEMKVLSLDEIKNMFRHIETILSTNKQLEELLSLRIDNDAWGNVARIGDVFLQMVRSSASHP